MSKINPIALLAFAACLSTLDTGRAATVTESFNFSATNFSFINGITPPVDTVTGSFTLTFDPTLSYSDSTAGIVLNSLNIPLGSAISFSYDPVADYLVVGGAFLGAGTIQILPALDDFFLQINNFVSNPTIHQLGYAEASIPNGYYYTPVDDPSTGTVTAAVPELSTWAMMLLGFAGVGFAAFRKGRIEAAVPVA